MKGREPVAKKKPPFTVTVTMPDGVSVTPAVLGKAYYHRPSAEERKRIAIGAEKKDFFVGVITGVHPQKELIVVEVPQNLIPWVNRVLLNGEAVKEKKEEEKASAPV
jgi:hypothetical protein